MRRKDREVTNMNQIHNIINHCHCCRLGFYDKGEVYIVPLNFGYELVDGRMALYFHSAKEGRKIELISKVNTIGFEMDTDYELKEGETACSHSARFQSIIGTGEITFVNQTAEKENALQVIMNHNTKKKDWQFTEEMLNAVCIFKVIVTKLSCKFHD